MYSRQTDHKAGARDWATKISVSPPSTCLCTYHFTLPAKLSGQREWVSVWMNVILVTTRVQDKVPPSLGPLSTPSPLFPQGPPLSWDVSVHLPLPPQRLRTLFPRPWQTQAFPRSGGAEPAHTQHTARLPFLPILFFLTLSTNPLRYCCSCSAERGTETKEVRSFFRKLDPILAG